MSADDPLAPFFAYVDAHSEEYIARLAEAIAIPSVSAEAARRPEVGCPATPLRWFRRGCCASHALLQRVVATI